MLHQQMLRLGQESIAASTTKYIELPKAGWFATLYMHFNLTLTVSGGSITVVDATVGAIPLVTNVSIELDGKAYPLNVSGRFLDIWRHIDKPGMERLALSGTSSGSDFSFVLAYALAQSEGNLSGAIRLSDYSSVRVIVAFGALSLIASGTGLAIGTGTVNVAAEIYSETSGLVIDDGFIHTLRVQTQDVVSTGEKTFDVPRGRAIERILAIPENNSVVGLWTALDSLGLKFGPSDEPYKLDTALWRALQMERYGGDDIPLAGVYSLDFRRAGQRDVFIAGDRLTAPFPQVTYVVNSSLSISTARMHFVLEEMQPFDTPLAA